MIKKLGEEVIRKIAAGQVASSPHLVLKELIENSLDAGAKSIRIHIDSPFDFKVIDDGRGIKFEELPVTIEKFTTDKIETVEDMLNLRTYGFRGEALNAISLSCELTLKSRHYSEDLGGKLEAVEGKIKSIKAISMNIGTSVTVKNLFFNAPVRRKSLNSKREIRKLILTVKDYAVANPDIHFHIDGYCHFPGARLEERIQHAYNLSGMKHIRSGSFYGFVVMKNERTPVKGIRKVFINKRPVEYEKLTKLLVDLGVENFVIFIELPPHLVDFNLSPSKNRIMIMDENALITEFKKEFRRKTYILDIPSRSLAIKENNGDSGGLKIIGSNETIIIAEDKNYFYFFDIHLVHERVNYEIMIEKLKSGDINMTRLSSPLVIKQGKNHLNKFKIPFSIEKGNIVIKQIPDILSVSDVLDIASGKDPEWVISSACKKAVKSGRFVSYENLEKLMEAYMKCKEKKFCPHGRPIYYRISKSEVYRNLGRVLKTR